MKMIKVVLLMSLIGVLVVSEVSAVLLHTDANYKYYKVPVPASSMMSSAVVERTCLENGMTPQCYTASYADHKCVQAPSNSPDGTHPRGMSKILCSTDRPTDCASTLNMFWYTIDSWRSGSACGATKAGSFCSTGKDYTSTIDMQYFAACLKPVTGCNIESGVYIAAGNDVNQMSSSGQEECSSACASTNSCVAWTMRTSDSYCWLKADDSSKGNSEGWITGTKECGIKADACDQQFAVGGFGKARVFSWSYNQAAGRCERFTHGGGYGGNKNIFGSRQECSNECEPGYTKTTSISLDDSYWGKWGNEETCMYPDFVNKMELKIESRQGGGDDTALNAIRLTCSDGHTISSTQQQWGTWRGARFCRGGFINTATIRRERKQSRGKDDSGGNGIRFRCTDGSKHYPGEGYWGYWSPWDSCQPGSAVYGIQTRVEPKRKGYDDTALNDVRFLCAKLPKDP